MCVLISLLVVLTDSLMLYDNSPIIAYFSSLLSYKLLVLFKSRIRDTVTKDAVLVGRRWGNACFPQNSTLQTETVSFPNPGAIIIFSSLIIFGISEKRVVSLAADLWIFRGTSTDAYSISVSFIFSLIFPSKIIFTEHCHFLLEFEQY